MDIIVHTLKTNYSKTVAYMVTSFFRTEQNGTVFTFGYTFPLKDAGTQSERLEWNN